MPKSELRVPTLEFLGHHLGATGIRLPADKANVIRNILPPTSVIKHRQFIGLANVYRRILPIRAELIRTTRQDFAQSTALKRATPLAEPGIKSSATSNLLSPTPPLPWHPKCNHPIEVTTDTYNAVVGAVLEQYHDGT